MAGCEVTPIPMPAAVGDTKLCALLKFPGTQEQADDQRMKSEATARAEAAAEETGVEYSAGIAVCERCAHTWAAIAPAAREEDAFECPKCLTLHGHYKFPFLRGDQEYTCDCGGTLFKITPDFIYCPMCGADHKLP